MIQTGTYLENRYEILEQIGTGGMSDVFKARDFKLGRLVAIKFLKEEFCEDKNFVANFQVEAQSAAALLHPNVVSVYDVSETNGIYYIVMEYVDGITLKKYIELNGALPVKEATSIAIQVAQGIEAAHNANIIHRDIKPQNILISREGKIKVTDFGIARTTTANTLSADILGSAQYISPEQARGDKVDVRSDIYSFGIVFYEMVTGQLPFDGDSPVTVALKHIQERVPLVSSVVSGIPSSVEKIIEKCTQKKPELRYQKTSFLLVDLKTSLVSPNEDFVVLETENDNSATIVMTGRDAERLREQGKNDDNPDELYFDPEADEEYYDDDYDDYDDDEASEDDTSGKKLDKVLKIGGIVAGAIILIVLIIVIISTFGNGCFGSDDETTTPSETETTETTTEEETGVEMIDVTGMDEETAVSLLEELGFRVVTRTEVSDEVDEGYVIEQSREAGETFSEGVSVTLTISSGSGTVVLDDYSGKTQSEVVEELKSLGLLTTITQEYSDEIEAGMVISTNPGAGTEVAEDTLVTVVVSMGKEVVTVPQLIGIAEVDALEMCEEAGLEVTIRYQTNNDYDGRVINQSLTAGSSVEIGSAITITVGEAEETTTETTTAETTTEPTTEETTSDNVEGEDTN